jgi:hypothetical protein
MRDKLYFLISGVVFAGVALLHLLRAVNSWQFQIGPFAVQNWMSYVAFVLAAALSVCGFWLASRNGRTQGASSN